MAQGPVILARSAFAHKGVVLRNRPVAIDAHDLAEIRREVLRGIEAHAVARGDEERPVTPEDKPVTEMPACDGFRLLPPDHAYIAEPVAVERRARNGPTPQPCVLQIEVAAK